MNKAPLKIVLPLPPTDNRRLIWSPRMKRFISSKEYRNWVKRCDLIFSSKYKILEMDDPTYGFQIQYVYKIFLPDKRTDIGNYSKAIKDFLKGRLYTDDHWVDLALDLPVQIDKENPRVEIYVE